MEIRVNLATNGHYGVVTTTWPVRFDAASKPEIFQQVVRLGDKNSKSLGFLPFAGFRTAAADSRIAVALDGDRVVGYCLFDLPRDVVRIVHVCVSEAGRGTQLARALVDAVGDRHADRLGMVLKCRADWSADKMWPKLGFSAQAQVPGRSRQQLPLTVWWRSHGHSDLFTLLEEQRAGRAAAIDSNVYSDLHSTKPRQGAIHTSVLAPLIADGQLHLVLLPSLEAEIYDTKDPQDRARFLSAKLHYTRVTNRLTREIVSHLLKDVPLEVLAKDKSLERDAELVAEAYANAVDLFVTRDRGAIRHLTSPAQELGIEVLHPTEVPTALDVAEAGHSYRPGQLEQTTVSVQRLDRALRSDEVALLLDQPGGERRSDLNGLIADLAARSTADLERRVLQDGDGQLLGAWAWGATDTFDVPLFRVVRGPLQVTLAAQLSRMVRMEAGARGVAVIRVTDRHLQSPVRGVLEADGFYPDGDGLAAVTVVEAGPWARISELAQGAAAEHPSEGLHRLLDLPQNPSPTQALEFERTLAPAKILGLGIPNYLVPIKRPFASQLLGHPASLMSRPDDLGLSREHVYYSSRRGIVKPPGRILWYVSGQVAPAVIAASMLVETRVDTPAKLHRLYSRLGVWTLQDIEAATANGKAAALRFTDTELFQHPVGLDRLRTLAPEGQRLLLRSAQRVDDEWYERIYRTGVQP